MERKWGGQVWRIASSLSRIAAVPAVALLLGCTASDITGSSDGPSANQAKALAEHFADAFSHAMSSASFSMAPRAAASRAPREAGSSTAGVPINWPLSGRTNCTAGGRIEVSGSITGNIDDQGSGILLLQVLKTITDWSCIPPYIVNGDPYLSAAGSISFQDGVQSSPASIDFGGGFKWGTSAAESFQIDMTMILNPDGSGRLSGVMGPHAVDVIF